MVGCFAVGKSPVYTVPSSPAAKVKVEQKPSEDVMSSVDPSVALTILAWFTNDFETLTM